MQRTHPPQFNQVIPKGLYVPNLSVLYCKLTLLQKQHFIKDISIVEIQDRLFVQVERYARKTTDWADSNKNAAIIAAIAKSYIS